MIMIITILDKKLFGKGCMKMKHKKLCIIIPILIVALVFLGFLLGIF